MPFEKLSKVNWDEAKSDEENIAAGALWSAADTDKIDANMDYAQGELDGLDGRVADLESAGGGGVTEDQMNTAIDTKIAAAETANVKGWQTAEEVQAIVDAGDYATSASLTALEERVAALESAGG